jgi:hypothetical protein
MATVNDGTGPRVPLHERRNKPVDRQKVQQRFPGLKCNRVEIVPDHAHRSEFTLIHVSLSGTAETLIQHGFITQRMIDLLPKCGSAWFPNSKQRRPRSEQKESADIRRGQLFHTKRGFRFEKTYRGLEQITAFLREVGIDDVELVSV